MGIDVAQQSCWAVAFILPPWIISDRVDAQTLDGHASLSCCLHLMPDNAQPSRSESSLDASLCHEQGALIPLVNVGQEMAERAVVWMLH